MSIGAGRPRHNNYYKMTGHFLVKNLISYKMSFYKAPNPTHFIREIQRGIRITINPKTVQAQGFQCNVQKTQEFPFILRVTLNFKVKRSSTPTLPTLCPKNVWDIPNRIAEMGIYLFDSTWRPAMGNSTTANRC